MPTYDNSFFHLRLAFPDAWRVTSWRTGIDQSWQPLYQAQDDELPIDSNCGSKFLFTAALHSPESEVIVDADIEMSVYRLPTGEDMRRNLIENFDRQRAMYENSGMTRLITKEGMWTLDSMGFTYVEQENKSRGGRSRYRFFFRSVGEALWLYGKVAGHKRQAYEEAIEIVEGLKSTANSID